MDKDFYLILGVPLDAAPDAIRSAFRKLAFRYHPDRGEISDPRAFREVHEAYEVLSDPARRARYDRERGRQAFAPRARRRAPMSDPEPLISAPLPVTGEPDAVRPSFEALLDRIWRNFTAEGATKGERAEPLDFELILTPREARRGIVVPFEVPALSICWQCDGSGRRGSFGCDACEGEGRIVERRSLEVRVPAGTRDGTWIEVSLASLGVENLWLRVRVRVAMH